MHGYGISKSSGSSKLTPGMLHRILDYFKPYIALLAFSVIAIFATSLLGLAPPLLLQQIIDQALPNQQFPFLLKLVLLSILAHVVLNLITTLQAYINMTISKNITFDMKNQMYRHLQHMSLGFFSSEKPGDIVTHMTSDIDGVSDVFHSTFVTLLTGVFTLSTTLFTLFSMNWKLALVSIATIPLFVIPTKKVGQARWEITKERQEKHSSLNSHIQETLSISGSTLMKVFTTEKNEYENFYDANKEVIALEKREQLTGRWFRMTITLLTTVGPLIVYLVGGYLVIQGEMTIGMVLTFSALLSRLYRPVMQLSSLHIDTMNSLALFHRIFDYFDRPQDIVDSEDALPIVISDGTIVFQNVDFSYNGSDPTLADMSFAAPGGKTTALVGPSGAGKTTVTSLLPRLYEIQKGSITIDGQNIQQVTLSSLRNQIGIVTQDPYLFNGSIRENLLYGKEDATEEELLSAAKAAYIHDFVSQLPNGYETIVGNRGIKLSGGEKQRISIARVILKNLKILILDEATSALDSISEKQVQKAMGPLMEGRTSLVIAHRLSTIQNADQILVVEAGGISGRGTHGELMSEKSIYHELYQKQIQDPLNQAS